LNKSFAWNARYVGDNKNWIEEVPTLVVGYALGKPQGKGKTEISASVLLGNGMRLAQDTRIIDETTAVVPRGVLEYIFTVLAIRFFQDTGRKPERILVYRDGGSEGSFDKLVKEELAGIRGAMKFLFGSLQEDKVECPENCNYGCIFCTPPGTLSPLRVSHPLLPGSPRLTLRGVSPFQFSNLCCLRKQPFDCYCTKRRVE
jgi:hypothetical protein